MAEPQTEQAILNSVYDATAQRLKTDATLTVTASDIQIGAVELKDGATDTRAVINAANTARTTATVVLATQHIDASGNVGVGATAANTARTTGTLVAPVQTVDAAGNVLGRTAANTARTTGTLVDPAQIVDASGNVINVTAANTARTTSTLTLPVQQVDAAGTVGGVTLNTLIAGEDQTNDVLKTENQFSYSYLTADGQVKGSAGFLHSITISPTDAAATAGSIIVYDSLTEANQVVFTYYIPAAALVPVTVILDIKMLTGIYVGFTTTADVCVTTSYR